MKILIFDNAALICKNDCIYINNQTGYFADELKNLSNDITFIQLTTNTSSINNFNLKDHKINVIPLKIYKIKFITYTLAYLRTIPLIYKSEYIYIFYPNSFKFASFIAKLLGKKYGLYIRGMNDLEGKVSHWIFRNAHTVLTVSDYFTRFINSIVEKNTAYTIRPMILFTEKDIITNRRYENKKKYQILYLGRISYDKGIIELLHAIYNMKNRDLNFFVKLVGNGENLDVFKNLAANLSLSEYVSFEGAVYKPEKIQEYYRESDIYILPTYHEGFPRTLYEAMIFGTPIITTFVGGIAALMRDKYNCREILPKSVDNIVSVLSDVLYNYSNVAYLVNNATDTIRKTIDSKRLSHAELLNEIINNK